MSDEYHKIEGPLGKVMLQGLVSSVGTGARNPPRACGLPCPKCEHKLVYTELGVIHQNPPRRRVKCPECDWKGFHYLEDGTAA